MNSYKYLGYTLTTKFSSNSACEEYDSKAWGKVVDLMKTVWSLGSLNTTVFFQLFDAQIKPLLLYASEIWGTSRLCITESAHPFACRKINRQAIRYTAKQEDIHCTSTKQSPPSDTG